MTGELNGYAGFLDRPWGRQGYRIHGAGSPLVVLHPLALSARLWDPFVGELADGRQLVAVDLRGHGDSSAADEPFGIGDLADDVRKVLDHVGAPTCDLLGVSLGGSVAAVFAGTYPELVDRLILCDTTAWYGPGAGQAWQQRALTARTADRESQLSFQFDRWFSEAFRRQNPSEVRRVADLFVRTRPAAHAQASLALGKLDARELLPAITARTLVLVGEDDYATPPQMADQLAGAIPGARVDVLQALRHLGIVESAWFRRLIKEFLTDRHQVTSVPRRLKGELS